MILYFNKTTQVTRQKDNLQASTLRMNLKNHPIDNRKKQNVVVVEL